MKVKENTKLLTLFSGFLLISLLYFNHTPRICVVAEIDLKREFILTTAPLTSEELDLARNCLRLVRTIDSTQHYEGFENVDVHWMRSKKYAGITVYKADGSVIILLDEGLKIKDVNNPWDYVKLGAIYSHELSHALNGTKDPHTESITDVKLWNIIRSDDKLLNRISRWKPTDNTLGQ